jgi:hypothetical protein
MKPMGALRPKGKRNMKSEFTSHGAGISGEQEVVVEFVYSISGE